MRLSFLKKRGHWPDVVLYGVICGNRISNLGGRRGHAFVQSLPPVSRVAEGPAANTNPVIRILCMQRYIFQNFG